MKSASFSPYLDLPRRTADRLELAIGNSSATRDQLRNYGWIVTDPLAVTRTAVTYQEFIRDSKAEFTVAKHGYVATRSGGFSQRSAAYLASGRPVATQDTGFSDWLRSDGGVLAFDSRDSAAGAVERVNRDYARQCRRARAVAEEFFESAAVLNGLLRRATEEHLQHPDKKGRPCMYDLRYYAAFRDGSRKSAEVIVPLIMEWAGAASVLDLGCGGGDWRSLFKGAGVREIHGVDGDYVRGEQLAISERDFTAHDLATPYLTSRRYDLTMSREVGEHLPAASAPCLVHSRINAAPLVLFSAPISQPARQVAH